MKSRIDRAFVSPSWSDIFTHARVLNLPPIHGDHVPILLGAHSVTVPLLKRKFCFCFESFWLQHDACDGVVRSSWDASVQGVPMSSMVRKIMNTRFSLIKWHKDTFGLRRKEIEVIRTRLLELLCQYPSMENQQESSLLFGKLDSLLAADHAYWKHRAKITWLTDGDRNTKFLHR